MKIWRAQYHHDDSPSGIVNIYGRSRKLVSMEVASIAGTAPKGFYLYGVEQVDVPTDKEGLITWLNTYAAAGD